MPYTHPEYLISTHELATLLETGADDLCILMQPSIWSRLKEVTRRFRVLRTMKKLTFQVPLSWTCPGLSPIMRAASTS